MKSAPLLSGGGWTGHLREFGADPLGLLTRFNAEIGDLGRLKFGPTELLVVNTPDLVRELLVEHHKSCRKSRFLRTVLHPLVGRGLFTSEGDLWRRQRQLMSPIFHPSHVAGFAPQMTEPALRCIDGWSDGDEIDAARDMTRIAMSVAGRTLFGADTFDEADTIGAALTVALEWSAAAALSVSLGAQVALADALDAAARRAPEGMQAHLASAAARLEHPVLWPGRRSARLKKAIAVLDAQVARMIDERRAHPQGFDDLLARLLEARDEDGSAMDDRQLRDEVLTLFVAGHETTATALSWALYLLARHPHVRDALEREADALDDLVPGADDLARLPLARQVFEESLRMYPPVPIYERQGLTDITIGGRRVRAGSYVTVFPWALHHHPNVWPDPEQFDPPRFSEENTRARHRYAWVPFGAGPRICIGNHFALQEGPLVLACIVARARLDLVSDAPVVPDPHAATLRPKGGIRMRVARRGRAAAGR